ncbi:MAG: response regulator transcription factor [Saprospiraceae bacterium]|nr:response regulator transcription factor [Saprospiraceae bacterium]
MIKCLIIDDDPLITDLIQHYCSKVPEIEYCISCNQALDGLKLISNQDFDILFLDYNMPELDGKGILEMKQDSSKVIMITSNKEFAVESYTYPDIIDFLLKPISFDRFYKSIEKYQSMGQEKPARRNPETFFVKDGTKWIQVQIKELTHIKSESNYVILYSKEKQIMSLMNLKDLENDLPDYFVRVHRSFIVNTKLIEYITSEEISIPGKIIPVGATYRNVVKNLLH